MMANDKLRIALLGAGGMGQGDAKDATLVPGVEIVATADIFDSRLQKMKETYPGIATTRDYREILARKDVDAVIVATPDHWHAQITVDALAAGKDVYCEKPMVQKIDDGKRVIAAAKKSGKIFQMGSQYASAHAFQKIRKLLATGAIGELNMVEAWLDRNTAIGAWQYSIPPDASPQNIDWDRFLGTAPQRAIEPKRFRAWRHFWDYAGGNMTDQGAHLMDVVLRLMKTPPPSAAVCQGYIAKCQGQEGPDVFMASFEFEKFLATWSLDYCTSYQNGWSITFLGNAGTMIMDEEGFRILGEPAEESKKEPVMTYKGGIPVESHIDNFLECLKTRNQPNCTVEIAQRAVAGPHLANIAYREGRKAKLAADLVTVS